MKHFVETRKKTRQFCNHQSGKQRQNSYNTTAANYNTRKIRPRAIKNIVGTRNVFACQTITHETTSRFWNRQKHETFQVSKVSKKEKKLNGQNVKPSSIKRWHIMVTITRLRESNAKPSNTHKKKKKLFEHKSLVASAQKYCVTPRNQSAARRSDKREEPLHHVLEEL